ncbi:hypothetical protein [Demequina sp.]|uniref:hypothetical protein n=1 Tax=Demequina sp. TaxID=2050685 RepID=UPI0025BB8D9A|nr:hypothetical protein [Demequina sp.]
MWERADGLARPAREFAQAHHLVYSGSVPLETAGNFPALPFANASPRHCVSGQWRGRPVQRFETGRYTVEVMGMSTRLPTLHVIPARLDRRALAIVGRVIATGDADFDRRWSVIGDNEGFAVALLTPGMREALMHPAADGRAVTFSGDQVSSWAQAEASWQEARVRLEFLAVLVGRISPDVQQRFDISTAAPLPEPSGWVPAAAEPEGPQWVVAQMPEPADTVKNRGLTDTGEFEVALLHAQLEGAAFLPEPEPTKDERGGSWLFAPAVH